MPSDDRGKTWAKYYAKTADRPPRRTLLDALSRFAPATASHLAVDLGCGDGRDTIELLRRGWSVLAIDAEPASIERLQRRPDLPAGARLSCLCERFEDASWPMADLVNASFSLPLCPPDRFPELWRRIVASLKPGGRFSGQLYGDRDGWVGRAGMTHMSRAAAERLLADLKIELFDEEETDSVTPRGKSKHWHIFHVVAQRP
ncbi:MAG TPA: class I SAM-dependent methyltransferase [Stellaceae bacterium]|nr:class I SAM-dependent methyltransferase [Stellaceae bacterium]